MTESTKEVREKIKAMYARIDTASYYEILELNVDLDQENLNSRAGEKFRELAGEWHVDRYKSHDLSGADIEKLKDIFSFLNTAHQVLTDQNRRAEYDMKRSGANTDIRSILNAESSFRRGQRMMENGSYKGAYEQFCIACETNADDLEYKAHSLYAEYMLISKNAKGRPVDAQRAREIYSELDAILEKMPDKDWLLAFLGIVAMGMGHLREAQTLFFEALRRNPKNVIARRQQRLIKMRKGRKKGIFAQIKNKLGFS